MEFSIILGARARAHRAIPSVSHYADRYIVISAVLEEKEEYGRSIA